MRNFILFSLLAFITNNWAENNLLSVDSKGEISGISKEQPKIFRNSIAMEFILIPAGSFQIGSNEYDIEQPSHEVKIEKPFYLGKYEVTQSQWKEIIGNNPSRFKKSLNTFESNIEVLWAIITGKDPYATKALLAENHPVENISWKEAWWFTQQLNKKEGTTKYRLPTEAEWEYAARAGSTNKWCFGNSENELENYAWYIKNSANKTHEVGQKKPNEFGLFDMHGNVWEWTCSDYESYSKNAYEKCSNTNNYRTIRGGSWMNNSEFVRSAYRGEHSTEFFRANYLGFRVLREF